MAERMRVIEYDRYGDAEVTVLRERAIPTPTPDQVLVRVRSAALNPKDILLRKGKYRVLSGFGFPKRMGYDFAGELTAVGARVRDFAVGDAVFGMIQSSRGGALAEYLALEVNQLVHKPHALSWDDAAALPLTSLTALQALRDVAWLRPGERVLIHGAAGGVGSVATQLAKALGAEVSAASSHESRALVEALGCDHWLDRTTDVLAVNEPYDVIFDTFGSLAFSAARRALARHGRFVSTVPSPTLLFDVARSFWRYPRAGLVVVRSRAPDLAEIAGMVSASKLRAVIDSVYDLSDLHAAQKRLESRRAHGKIVIRLPA